MNYWTYSSPSLVSEACTCCSLYPSCSSFPTFCPAHSSPFWSPLEHPLSQDAFLHHLKTRASSPSVCCHIKTCSDGWFFHSTNHLLGGGIIILVFVFPTRQLALQVQTISESQLYRPVFSMVPGIAIPHINICWITEHKINWYYVYVNSMSCCKPCINLHDFVSKLF